MKALLITVLLIYGCATPAIAAFTPSNAGGPKGTQGSGTRLLKPVNFGN